MTFLNPAEPQRPEREQPSGGASASSNPLHSALARVYTIDWEVVFYVALFVLAVVSRFVNLGDRVMSHDESLHTKYSHDLYAGRGFQHSPLMHGPVLFHMTALNYFLFGASDFSARIYPAVLGIIMVLMPKLLFERWLGKLGAMASSVLILISPMLLYHHRYIREDTPAIFFTILMVYAIFAYVDGVRPRQVKFLILLSGATLLNLASKETAFMYILIFAAFAGLVVLFQMLQGWLSGKHTPAVSMALLGIGIVPASGVLATLLIARLDLKARIGEAVPLFGTTISGETVVMLFTLIIGVPLAGVLSAGLFVLVGQIWKLVRGTGSNALSAVGIRGDSLLRLVLVGTLVGVVAALMMTNVLSLIPPENTKRAAEAWALYDANPTGIAPNDYRPEDLNTRLVLWTLSLAMALSFAVMGTALLRYTRMPRLPWGDILLIAGIALAVCLVLVIFEERSRLVPNVSSEVRGTPSVFDNMWIYGTWVVGVPAIVGIVLLRLRTTFWQEMQRYPMFDVIIMLGSLVLPWSAALAIFQAGYPLDGSYADSRVINASIMGLIPFIGVSVAAGLSWRPSVWIVCTATFYALFAFFFTTIFTNAVGVATGVVGSLGYWLTQQGVKRGSQPQYYYMLIQLPIYEFLPVIGSLFAGVAGLAGYWKLRALRTENRQRERDEAMLAMATPYRPETESNEAETLVAESRDTQAYLDLESLRRPEPSTEILETTADAEKLPEPPERPYRGPTETVAEVQFGRSAILSIPVEEVIIRPPFLPFVGFWALLILAALTFSGEKMPWLTTHITLPMCLLTGWYLGVLLEKVNWDGFFKQTWTLLLLIPAFLIGAINTFGVLLTDQSPFGSLARQDQMITFAWLGAALLTGLVGYAIYRIWQANGTAQIIRVGVLGFFVLLGVLTARAAWMAAYINYDYPTEFLVYAHAAPANKWVLDYLDEIRRRSTDGVELKIGYDNEVSWPGSWYFRDYPGAIYVGEMTGMTDAGTYAALVVGDNNAPKIEAQLADNYYRYDFNRLWWPMQVYFDLNIRRIDHSLGDAGMRKALWDIWLNRDYSAFTEANMRLTGDTNTKFELDTWPVTDRMVFFVRKDIAAGIWDFGVGTAKVTGLPEDPFATRRCDTCAASLAFSSGDFRLTNPRDVAVGPDGSVYVMDSQNARVMVYGLDGNLSRQFGAFSVITTENPNPEPGTFREPWGIAVGKDGTIYVADTWNHRVQAFSAAGEVLRAWGTFGQYDASVPGAQISPDALYGPRDIAVDVQNRVYVADTGNKRVRVYTSEGVWLYDIGTGGTEAGKLNEPVGLAISDELNELYIASTWNKRIDVFTLTGTYLRSWSIPGWYATTVSADSGNRPFIALDAEDRYLFVSDPDVGRILVYDVLGNPVLAFGRLGAAPFNLLNQFGALGGMAFDTEGQMYLVDTGGGRVVRFAPDAFPGLVRGSNQSVPVEVGTEPATPRDF